MQEDGAGCNGSHRTPHTAHGTLHSALRTPYSALITLLRSTRIVNEPDRCPSTDHARTDDWLLSYPERYDCEAFTERLLNACGTFVFSDSRDAERIPFGSSQVPALACKRLYRPVTGTSNNNKPSESYWCRSSIISPNVENTFLDKFRNSSRSLCSKCLKSSMCCCFSVIGEMLPDSIAGVNRSLFPFDWGTVIPVDWPIKNMDKICFILIVNPISNHVTFRISLIFSTILNICNAGKCDGAL